MSEKRQGPRVTIERSCDNCVYERSERYAVQGDSGCDVYCTDPAHHDEQAGSIANYIGRHVGDTTWNTPEWCRFIERKSSP